MSFSEKTAKRLRSLPSRFHSWRMRPRFQRLDSLLDPRVEVTNPQCISIGRNTQIRAQTWLYAITSDKGQTNIYNPTLEIGDNCIIGRFCYFTCSNRLVIEDSVLIMESVLITDSIHGYEDISVPVISQPLVSRGPVIIGSGSWIGVGACIVGTVRIGRHCVVGANAFVNRDVPDYCVVAGNPAQIVRRHDMASGQWINVREPLPRSER